MSQFSSSKEQIFSKLFHATAEKYQQGRQKVSGLIDAQGKAFLSSIGYTEEEFFDFIEDYTGIVGESILWRRKAANDGDTNAQSSLGYIYANGVGVARDYYQAAFWYYKAADKGDASAQCGLGYLYANGLGVAQDYSQAAFWYCKAAEKGSEFSQLYLGYQCQYGQGVPQDNSQAIFWFRKAADQGNAQARENLKKMGVSLTSNSSDEGSTTSSKS